jgi:hypothetical protein
MQHNLPFIVMNPNPQHAHASGQRAWQQWQHLGIESCLSNVVQWCQNHIANHFEVYPSRAMFEVGTDAQIFESWWGNPASVVETCCLTLQEWIEKGLIVKTKVVPIMGIDLQSPDKTFAVIAYCPFCGSHISAIDRTLVGRATSTMIAG